MKLTWFGHSAFRLQFGSSVVVIDPFLSGNPRFEGDVAAATQGATHILLTHAHSDHVGDTVAIAKETGAKIVANYELCLWLSRQGVAAIDPMNTGGTTDQGDFTVTLTIAFHSSAEVDSSGNFQSLGLPNGIVVTPKGGTEPTIYHLGDTDIFSDMALIDEIYEPAVAIIPIGDRFTMGARTAALAAKRFLRHAKTVIPCHYATFPPLVQTVEPFLAEMGEERDRVVVPQIGKPFDL